MASNEEAQVLDEGGLMSNSQSQSSGFDATKKKKKKPKKRGEDETAEAAAAATGGEAGDGAAAPPVEAVEKSLSEMTVDPPSDSMFAGLKKPKRKPRKVEDEDTATAEGDKEAAGEEGKAKAEGEEGANDADRTGAGEDEEGDDDGADDMDDIDDEPAGEIELAPRCAWEGSDRDYLYEECLDRVFNILRENNPELAGLKRRTVMRPPQVLREGTKKTVFANFMDLCKSMHRQPEHVMAFLLAELGTSGSLDGQQRLVVKGRFAPKNFEGILRRYVNEYVMCSGCKSPDTILSKENRLFFLRCEQCGSSRSVASITAGFVARVGRRKLQA
eukprot:TRINITY_DN362_c1_g1_i1.p2 TRINITY_DN362_c1_g1~~TRINITY_DN362_c1_g1_i1.p2  ORF type:complete len:330 (-),score=106.24 TRINITY_DN362_c1_g1_i1:396-1385(-)